MRNFISSVIISQSHALWLVLASQDREGKKIKGTNCDFISWINRHLELSWDKEKHLTTLFQSSKNSTN